MPQQERRKFWMEPIGRIRREEDGVVLEIDAYDGTEIVDLKAYLPICDRVERPRTPSWLDNWPAWLPESGMRLVDPKA